MTMLHICCHEHLNPITALSQVHTQCRTHTHARTILRGSKTRYCKRQSPLYVTSANLHTISVIKMALNATS